MNERVDPPRPARRASSIPVRTALVVLPLAVVRAGWHAAVDGYLRADTARLFARSFGRELLESAALAIAPALLLCVAATALAGRGRLVRGLPWLAGAALAFGFLTYRVPFEERYLMSAWSAQRWVVVGGVAVLSLAASAVAFPGVRVPRAGAFALLLPVALAAAFAVRLFLELGREDDERPNLILISLDTLRLDHIGCYGYERDTTPELDAFAERALRFDNGFSPQPWTLTAHMSMLTGLYPSVHGLTQERALPRSIPTLADLLRAADYTTLGIVDTVAFLQPMYGYSRGFDVYEQITNEARLKVDRIEDVLDDAAGEPFFLFAHFYDAHSDWDRLPYEGARADQEQLAPWYDGDPNGDAAWCNGAGACASQMLLDLFTAGEQLDAERTQKLRDLYDAGVRGLDRELGRMFDVLERRGLMDDTVILITADHGEEFFDHGKPLHGACFDECLNVPFLLYGPGFAPGASDAVVSHVDIARTFLDLARAGEPPVDQGLSLVPLARGERDRLDRDAVLLEQIGGFRGLRAENWSLVPHGTERLLFDHSGDPGQRNPLGPDDAPAAHRTLTEKLAALAAESDALAERFAADGVSVKLGEHDQKMLQDLGYAGD